MGRGEPGDPRGGLLRVAQVEGEAFCRAEILQGLLAVGPDDRLDAQPPGRLQEIVRAVGRGREEEKDAGQTRSSIGM